MRNLDSLLIGIVFVIWAILAYLYATVDMTYMPPAIRIWGLVCRDFPGPGHRYRHG